MLSVGSADLNGIRRPTRSIVLASTRVGLHSQKWDAYAPEKGKMDDSRDV